jgi:uncharacterized protein (TIGR02147 family)
MWVNYQIWLQSEFEKRVKVNPRYSLRAFARLLQLDPSTVSQLLSGKRRASNNMLERLFAKLEVSPEIRQKLLIKQQTGINNYDQISADVFAVISDWYHYAILELTFVKNFQSDARWISQQLNIPADIATAAIQRMIRIGLLKQDENGKLTKEQKYIVNYKEGDTSAAHKSFQKEVIKKALESIDSTPQPEKDITSITFAIDESKIPIAKERIKNFRRALSEELETGKQTRVYNLAIQLYPISEKMKDENETHY